MTSSGICGNFETKIDLSLFTSFSEVFMSTEYMPIPQDSKMAKRFWSMVKGLILTIILLSIMWLVYSDVQQHGGTFLHRRCFKAIGDEFFQFFFKIRLHWTLLPFFTEQALKNFPILLSKLLYPLRINREKIVKFSFLSGKGNSSIW